MKQTKITFLIHEATFYPNKTWDKLLGSTDNFSKALKLAEDHVSKWQQEGDRVKVIRHTKKDETQPYAWSVKILDDFDQPTDYGAYITTQLEPI